jgi:tetratricopeptide (TPR) repeat protein
MAVPTGGADSRWPGAVGGTPAILAAAKVKSPWVLAGAAAAAVMFVAVGAVWQQRWQRQAQRRDEQDFGVEDGCLVLFDGRLPTVGEISDPVLVGVHRAQVLDARASSGETLAEAPAYVPRDADGELRERLAAGGFVLLIGDSAAGKSRAAFEGMRAELPGHVLVRPSGRDAVGPAVGRAARERRCVLWLDDLERYLGAGGLTTERVGRLLAGAGHHRVIVATIRAAELERLSTQVEADDDAGQQAVSDLRQILDQAHQIRIGRMFSEPELGRALARVWDPRIAAAVERAGAYGIAEYLSAGPQLLRAWQDARDSSAGRHSRGAALVASAIDVRRAGWTSPLPRGLLDQVCEQYLAGPECAHVPREPSGQAWDWATRRREATTALLRPVPSNPGLVEVFDYLVDAIQHTEEPLARVPEAVIRAAIGYAGGADADAIASVAYAQGRYPLSEHASRHAYQAQASDPARGADHPDTLTSRNNHALALRGLGRLEEAEAELRAVLDARTRVLGASHPDTLASRNHLAAVLRTQGRLEEAEAEHRCELEACIRVLGADHPLTLASRNNLATVLRSLGRLQESEAESRALVEACTRVLGANHFDTLYSRINLAHSLRSLGRLDEAEAEHRAVVDASTQVMGADHPFTLLERDVHAQALRCLGRFGEAETEHRAVLEALTRVLGADHGDTLISRRNHALVLHDLGRLEEAEAEHRAVLEGLTRVLGADHPETLASRKNHAFVSRDLRQGAEE